MGASLKSWVCALAVIAIGGCWLAAGQDAAPPSAPPSTPNAGAERPAGGGRRTFEGFGELRWLSQQLNLTEEQKQKLRPIVMDEGEQMKTVRLDEHLPLDQKRAKMQEVAGILCVPAEDRVDFDSGAAGEVEENAGGRAGEASRKREGSGF